jgi:Tol biopolymer transport system component
MLDRDGNEHDTGLPPRRYSYVKYSPDGSKLALEIEEEESAIWIYDLETGTQVKKLADGSYPVWTPGGTHITFTGFRSGSPGLYRVSLDNPDNIEELFVGNYPINHSYTWSGDEQVLVFTEVHPVTGMNVLALKKPDMRDPLSILASPSQECCPAISPDDRWLAYVSDESGRPEIYVTSFPDRRTTHRVSSSGGREPVWSHRENILYYWQDRQLMMVDLTDETALDNAVPVRLFEGVFVSSTSTWRSRYDVHPGGNRFVILKRGPEEMGVTILKKIQDFHKLIRNRPGGEI